MPFSCPYFDFRKYLCLHCLGSLLTLFIQNPRSNKNASSCNRLSDEVLQIFMIAIHLRKNISLHSDLTIKLICEACVPLLKLHVRFRTIKYKIQQVVNYTCILSQNLKTLQLQMCFISCLKSLNTNQLDINKIN